MKILKALVIAVCVWWIATCVLDMFLETMDRTGGTMLEEEIWYYSFAYPIIAAVIAFAVTLRMYLKRGP